jgi:hypothetical protein
MGSKKQIGKKAQAATEYLHTYGWVFLTALVIGGVLIYHNFGSAKSVLPNECIFLSGIRCIDVMTDNTLLSIAVINEFGFDINNVEIAVSGTCNSTANTTDGNPFGNLNVLLANTQAIYILECQNLSNTKISELITVDYVNVATGEAHVKVGKLDYSPLES